MTSPVYKPISTAVVIICSQPRIRCEIRLFSLARPQNHVKSQRPKGNIFSQSPGRIPMFAH